MNDPRYYRLNGNGDIQPGQVELLYDSHEDMLVAWRMVGRFQPDALDECRTDMDRLGIPNGAVLKRALATLEDVRRFHVETAS